MWYSLLLLGCKPVPHFTVLNTVGNCNKMVSIIEFYYNIIILLDHRRICGPSTETSLRGMMIRNALRCCPSCNLDMKVNAYSGKCVNLLDAFRTAVKSWLAIAWNRWLNECLRTVCLLFEASRPMVWLLLFRWIPLSGSSGLKWQVNEADHSSPINSKVRTSGSLLQLPYIILWFA
jgi:hypothetical protein